MFPLRRPTTLLYHSRIISNTKFLIIPCVVQSSTKKKKYLPIIVVKSGTESIWPKVHIREVALSVLTTRADTYTDLRFFDR